jgi:glycosyltransferase involved in cell wall biosynthesis
MAVVVCTSTRDRLPLLLGCIDSLLHSDRRPDELFVVVDGPPSLENELAKSLPSPARLLRSAGHGLSAARNTGLAAASAELVAFVDDDARVDRGWLRSLATALAAEPAVVGVGGPVLPLWEADRRWMPDELLWVVGCTYNGHRSQAGPIRNPIGCNMAFRRLPLVAAGGFSTTFGKRGGALQTCDETELGLRLERLLGPGRIVFVPGARVDHFVPAQRVSWRLLLRRSVSEGLAKGRLHRLYHGTALGPERSYVRLLLVDAVPRLLLDSVRRRDRQLATGALAIAASLVIAAAAFVAGLAGEWRRDATRSRAPETMPAPPDAAG